MNIRRSLSAVAVLALAWQGSRSLAQNPAPIPAKDAPPAMTSAPQANSYDPAFSSEASGNGGLRGGYGLYILKPHWDNNPAFRTAVTAGNSVIAADTDFNWDYQTANAIWLGAVNDSGFGGRIRWFFFDQDSQAMQANIPADPSVSVRSAAPLGLNIDFPRNNNNFASEGGVLEATSDLQMNVWDFEAMQELNFARWSMLITGGIRYAHISQNYKAFLVGREVNNGNQNQPEFDVHGTLISGHNFNGAGPTASVAVRRSIGGSNLSIFAMGRGAILCGRGIQESDLLVVRTRVRDGEGGRITIDQDSASASWDQVIPVAEFELGVDWTRNVGGSVLFFEVAVVGQGWFGLGNAANNDIIGNANGNTDEISDNKSNLGLFGVKIAGGIGW